MSIAQFSLAGASVADASQSTTAPKKAPPRRIFVAVADTKLIPEPR